MKQVALDDPDGVRWIPREHSGVGVLALAGSSGRIEGDRSRLFAELGCVAESIRWFGGPGQHDRPWEIPLEIFFDRIKALKSECDRVYVVGTSFGSEAALLCGAHSDDVDGVVAFAPSDVVWGAPDPHGRVTSHWTLNAEPLPFVPFDWDGYSREQPARFRPVYQRSRTTFSDRIAAATIPVDRIPQLVLAAGADDQVWPSTLHASRIQSMRAAAGVETIVLVDPDAGHRTILPGEQIASGGVALRRGGTEAADRRLGTFAWGAITNLLEIGR